MAAVAVVTGHYQFDALNSMPSFYAIDFVVQEFVDRQIVIRLVVVVKLHVANGDGRLVVKIIDCGTEKKRTEENVKII